MSSSPSAQRSVRPEATAPRRASASATVAEKRDAAHRILQLSRRLRHAEVQAKRGRMWATRAWVLSPVRAIREAATAVRRYGKVTQQDSGVSLARQFAAMWWLNLRFDYRTDTVYRFRLFSRERALPIPLFAQWHDAALLFNIVGDRVARDAVQTLADKRRFARWCASNGIASPPIFMEFEKGSLTHSSVDPEAPPRVDLFAKWGTQYGGDDTQLWRFQDGRYIGDDGRAWRFEEVVTHLTERSRDGVVLMQPRLVNHPELRRISPRALSTIRVMTTRRPHEEPRYLAGVLRMGTGSSTADNFAQGGIASAVDGATGIAGPARRLDDQHRTHVLERHPDTQVTIPGTKLPFWEQAVDLAIAAHARLGPIACVGWDVAVLEDGPVLLEGNWNPCTKLLQVATQTPLLATDFADVFSAWLDDPACEVDDRYLVDQANWKPV